MIDQRRYRYQIVPHRLSEQALRTGYDAWQQVLRGSSFNLAMWAHSWGGRLWGHIFAVSDHSLRPQTHGPHRTIFSPNVLSERKEDSLCHE